MTFITYRSYTENSPFTDCNQAHFRCKCLIHSLGMHVFGWLMILVTQNSVCPRNFRPLPWILPIRIHKLRSMSVEIHRLKPRRCTPFVALHFSVWLYGLPPETPTYLLLKYSNTRISVYTCSVSVAPLPFKSKLRLTFIAPLPYLSLIRQILAYNVTLA